MNRHTVGYVVVSVIVIAVVAGLPAIGYAQQDGGQFSVQWKDITVADALAALQRQFGIQYALSGELSSRRITLSLDNVTPVQALQQILSTAQLTAVNENGVWRIREVAQAETGGRTYRPGSAVGVAARPTPYRPTPAGVNVGGAGGLGMTGPGSGMPGMSMGLQPGTTGLGGTGLTTLGTQQTLRTYSPEDMIFRIIPLKFIDPYIVADMFGGGIVGGGGGGYGSDYYGSDRYGSDRYGSSRYGSDRYGSDRYGSSRYGNDRYGSDRYGSDRYGSSRYGSSSRYDDWRY